MNKKRIKEINNKEDAITFLNQLIKLVYPKMIRLRNVLENLKDFIESLDKEVNSISYDIYTDYFDKLSYLVPYLLNAFGDETKLAVSYKVFRSVIRKKKGLFKLDELDEKVEKILKICRENRNWVLHIPQSLLNSQLEYNINEEKISKDIFEKLYLSEEVNINIWKTIEDKYLIELYEISNDAYSDFLIVFDSIKKDYSKLVGRDIKIIEKINMHAKPYKFNKIVDNSFLINNGKIK